MPTIVGTGGGGGGSGSSTLTLGGTAYSPAQRAGIRLAIDRLTLTTDEFHTLEFHQVGQTLPAQFAPGTAVVWTFGGVPYFSGQVVQATPSFSGDAGWTVAYTAYDLKYLANLLPVTNPNDLTGTISFNLPAADGGDQDPDYVAALAGQSVGQILAYVFGNHAAALAGVGVAGYVPSDLTPLTLVPPEPVVFQGPSLFNAVDSFLDRWAGHYACWIEYRAATSDYRIRVGDTTAFTPVTLTMGTDPIDPPSISRDVTASYSRVVIRGRARTESLFCSTADLTLTPAWTHAQQLAWKWSDWTDPGGAVDSGSISALGSTTVTVSSSDASRAWATNFWSTNQGSIWLINPVATDITQQEMRKVTACTAMTAGGTATITLDRPLVNGGYTKYRLVCQPVNSNIDVWRRYNVVNTFAAAHLENRFNVPVPWANNGEVTFVSYPVGAVDQGLVEFPALFETDPTTGTIRFVEPVVKQFNDMATLVTGGSSVVAPTDVKALIAYSRGTLTAVKPASGYSGTLYSADGISRTWTVDQPGWINAADQAQYDALAQLRLDTVKDTVLNGQVTVNGLYQAALTLGMAINIAGTGYTCGWESIACPVRQVVLNWPGSGANSWTTTLVANNRRKPATGESYYVHPAFTGGAAWEVQGAQFSIEGFGGLDAPSNPASDALDDQEGSSFGLIAGAAQAGDAARAAGASSKPAFTVPAGPSGLAVQSGASQESDAAEAEAWDAFAGGDGGDSE